MSDDRNEALRMADSIHEMNNAAYMTAIANLREQVTRANREATRIVALLDAANAERDQLRAEVERLRADAERLNHIEKHARCDPKMDGQHVWWPTNFKHALRGATLRAAIDQARTTHKDEG